MTTAVIHPASHSSAAERNIHGSESNGSCDCNCGDWGHCGCGDCVYYVPQTTQPETEGTLWAGVRPCHAAGGRFAQGRGSARIPSEAAGEVQYSSAIGGEPVRFRRALERSAGAICG